MTATTQAARNLVEHAAAHASVAEADGNAERADGARDLLADAYQVKALADWHADLRADLAASLRKHYFPSQKHGIEWLTARVAEDLGLR